MDDSHGGDSYRLERFVAAQDAGGTYGRAVAELRAGRKVSHWMWFVFPQIAGLGRSATAQEFSISSLHEARAYLRHPVLGPRLAESARVLTEVAGRSAEQIFGSLDAQKLRSSMTLFLRADPERSDAAGPEDAAGPAWAGPEDAAEPAGALFAQVLSQYFDGQPDPATDRLLGDVSPARPAG
ncbi:MAG: DUF1810 domain-containing protein [Streptosporangiaceae bacterium]